MLFVVFLLTENERLVYSYIALFDNTDF